MRPKQSQSALGQTQRPTSATLRPTFPSRSLTLSLPLALALPFIFHDSLPHFSSHSSYSLALSFSHSLLLHLRDSAHLPSKKARRGSRSNNNVKNEDGDSNDNEAFTFKTAFVTGGSGTTSYPFSYLLRDHWGSHSLVDYIHSHKKLIRVCGTRID